MLTSSARHLLLVLSTSFDQAKQTFPLRISQHRRYSFRRPEVQLAADLLYLIRYLEPVAVPGLVTQGRPSTLI